MTYTLTGAINPLAAQALMDDYGFDGNAMLYLIHWQNHLELTSASPTGISPLAGRNKNGQHQVVWLKYEILSEGVKIKILEVQECA